MVSRNTATAEICAQVFALRFPMRAEQQSLENIQTDQGSWFHINQQKRGWVLDIHPLRQRRGEGHRERAGRCPAFSLNHDFECVDRPAVMPHIQFSWCGECYNGQQWRDELCSIERERESDARKNGIANRVLWRHLHRVRRPDTPTPRRGHPRQAPLQRCAATRGTTGE